MLPFDTPAALYLNELRWQHFLTLGLPVSGLRVLELGAGVGHFTQRLLAAGARRVMALEGRAANVRVLRERCPRALSVCTDLERPSYSYSGDLGFCYGLLYHLREPWTFLGRLRVPVLALETIVIPGKGEGHLVQEWPAVDQGLGNQAYYPTRPELENWLHTYWPYVYHPAPPNYHEYPQAWPMQTDWGRVVYVASLDPLPHLEEVLL